MRVFQIQALPMRVSLALLPVRVAAGAAFMFHGWTKIQDPLNWMPEGSEVPGILQALAAVSEFGGGLAWILGLLTPLASIGIASTMGVAVHMHAIVKQDPFVASSAEQGSFEPALVYFCLALLFFIAGPGRFSADQVAFGQRP